MRKEDLKDWTRDKMKEEIIRLDKENTNIQNSHIKLYNDTKDEIRELKEIIKRLEEDNSKYAGAKTMYIDNLEKCESLNERLHKKNQEMEAEIQRLREKCGEVPVDTEKSFTYDTSPDYEKLCCELQNRHQQDCIRINDLTTTVNVLTGLYANLRKNMGMD